MDIVLYNIYIGLNSMLQHGMCLHVWSTAGKNEPRILYSIVSMAEQHVTTWHVPTCM